MEKFTGVSIVTGAVTETDSLRRTVDFVLENCNCSDLAEIIIGYPDRATPECVAVIKELEERENKVWSFVQKRPKLGFLTEAFDAAKGSHIITVDSDMALDLELIPKMVEGAKKEPDTIFSASRWLGGSSFERYNRFKVIVNFLSQKFLAVLYQSKLTDFTIPFQIVPAELLRSINFEETGFAIFIEMVLKPVRLGCKIKELPTNCHGRTQGKSNNSFAQLPSYLRTALHVRFMKKEDIMKKNCQ